MDLVLIALSARPLAASTARASAARGGVSTLVFDLDGRDETRNHAGHSIKVAARLPAGPDSAAPAFDAPSLLEALATHAPAGVPVIIGSGLDAEPDLLSRIAARNPILGNTPTTVRVLKDPLALTALCGHLRLPSPAICMDTPDPDFFAAGAVVEKRIGGSDGLLVRVREGNDHSAPLPGHYLQQQVPGTPYALLLLANGREVVEIGACRLWHAGDVDRTTPFHRNAMTGPVALPEPFRQVISAGARAIALACGLVGLVRIDLMIAPESWHVLGVTPHPEESFDLFDMPPMPALLGLHIAACGGRLPAALPAPSGETVRATAVLTAPHDLVMPALPPVGPDLALHDLAPQGERLTRGRLAASLHVSAATAQEAEAALNAALRPLQLLLEAAPRAS